MTPMPVHQGACAPAPAAKNSNATNAAVARLIRARRETASELHDRVVGHDDLHYRVDELWCKADPAKLPVSHERIQSASGTAPTSMMKTRVTRPPPPARWHSTARQTRCASGGGGLKTVPDIVTITKGYPNFTGIYLDDFVKNAQKRPDSRKVGKPAMAEAELKTMRDQLGKAGRPMVVWTTIYSRVFDPKNPDFTDCEPPLVESMKHLDVLVLWTWKSVELADLEKNLALGSPSSRRPVASSWASISGITPASMRRRKRTQPTAGASPCRSTSWSTSAASA
jgi:hypothetical protein